MGDKQQVTNMFYFHRIVFYFLLAGTFCLAQGAERNCRLLDGGILRDGESTNDTCSTCYCQSGLLQCEDVTCAIPNCVDPALIPGQCCPTCPNGPNCALPGGGALSAGRSKLISVGQLCRCPREIDGLYFADCRFPVDTAN